MGKPRYYAVIGDIKNSRQLVQREEVQSCLKRVLNGINHEYSAALAAEFVITLGDEFQGLLKRPDELLRIIDQIRFSLRPLRLRIGVGIGAIHTEIDPDRALGADGPAYYAAREMIESIRRAERGRENPLRDICISDGTDSPLIGVINAALGLTSLIEEDWSERQQQAVSMMLFTSATQKEAAERLGIARSSMQRRLKTAHYYEFRDVRIKLSELILTEWGSDVA